MGTVTGIELPSFGNCPRNSGEVIGKFHRRHRAKEFLAFLNEIDRQVPEDLDVYLIMDNYGTRKTEKVRAWFAARPRYQVHFTPTSASWINLVEHFFALILQRWIKRGSHRSTRELEESRTRSASIRERTTTNQDPSSGTKRPIRSSHPSRG